MLAACDKVLEAINSLLISKLSRVDFEKPISEALNDSHYSKDQDEISSETNDSESGEETMKIIQPSTSAVIGSQSFSVASTSKPNQLTEATKRQSKLTNSMHSNIIDSHNSKDVVTSATISNPMVNPISIEELTYFVELARKISISNNKSHIDNTNSSHPIIRSTPEVKLPNKETNDQNDFAVPVQRTLNQTQESPNYFNHFHSALLPIHKWNILFDGSPNGSPIDRFLYRVEHLARSNKIPVDKLVNDLHILLRKNALEWYWSYLERKGFVQWGDLTTDMRNRFQDRRTDFEIRQTIVARRQKPKENFMDFYSEILDATLSLNQPLPESDFFYIKTKYEF